MNFKQPILPLTNREPPITEARLNINNMRPGFHDSISTASSISDLATINIAENGQSTPIVPPPFDGRIDDTWTS